MSDTFNFQRFGRYFRFDLSRMWRNNTKTAILLGCGSILTVIVCGIGGLLFTMHWFPATDPARMLGFFICLGVLELLMAKTYGFVTDRKEGSDFLMIPASTLEKWLSMMLVCLVVIPVLFLVTYFLVDGFVCAILPDTGTPLYQWTYDTFVFANVKFDELNAALDARQIPLHYSIASLIGPVLVGACFNYLFFLLCGLLFKRHKILNAIFVMMVVSSLFGIIAPYILPDFEAMAAGMSEAEAINFSDSFMRITTLITGLLAALLAAGCFFRLRKIAH